MKAVPKIVAVIDDDPSILRALRRLLTVAGCKVHVFISGHDFWARKGEQSWDFIISDVQMPLMNGLELQDRLLAYGYNLPLIFVTAFDDPRVKKKAFDAGAMAYLQKPLDHRVLLEIVQANMKTI